VRQIERKISLKIDLRLCAVVQNIACTHLLHTASPIIFLHNSDISRVFDCKLKKFKDVPEKRLHNLIETAEII